MSSSRSHRAAALRRLAASTLLLPILLLPNSPTVDAADCHFTLGFSTLQRLIPSQVGDCLDNEIHDEATGDALQLTTGGVLVWRRADNWTAFTDGSHTWINGPLGLQERLNSERFDWETDAGNPMTSQPAATGLQGTITLGPNTPTCFSGTPCSTPLAATVTVQDAAGQTVTQFSSGADGRFQVDLPPGTYTLVPQRLDPNTNYPFPVTIAATVPAAGYAQVDVRYDSLIR